jgi:hypothetical protein
MICHGGQSAGGYMVGGFSPKKRTCHEKFFAYNEVMSVLAKYYLSVDAWRAALVMIIRSHFHSGTMFGVEL